VPTITSVSGPAIDGVAFSIAGTNLGTATVKLIYDTVEVAQTLATNTATAITIAALDCTGLPYKTVTLNVAVAAGTVTRALAQVPAAGYGYVTVDVPWGLTELSIFDGDTPTDVADGDQVEYQIASNYDAAVTVFEDGCVLVDAETRMHRFDVRIWDESGLDWGASTEITVMPDGYVPGSPAWIDPDIADYDLAYQDAFTLDVSDGFADPDDDIATYELVGDWPTWASVDAATGVVTGTALEGTWSALQVRASDTGGRSGLTNAFSITVAGPVVTTTATDVDRIAFRHDRRVINERSGMEVTAHFLGSEGTPAIPTTVHWRLDNETTGAVVQDWTAVTTTTTATDALVATDCYAEIVIAGSLHSCASGRRMEQYTLLVCADKDLTGELSETFSYQVRNLRGRD
jgi:hypothetical protein